MAKKSLAVQYRPQTFDDVVEQNNIKIILKQQLKADKIKHAYLFVGGAGTGKTTCARIFANEINKSKGNPIEMDAASNSGVDDVRNIIQQAKTKSLDSEYKVFIIDECHAISNTGWQAFLKLLEEPPAKSIFIFCTTDPQKIPKTILSRVQRYDFQRISHEGIVNRLHDILVSEQKADYYNSGKASDITYKGEALEYIAKLADGGMRDAITLMDKCLAFDADLTVENVVKALGVTDYQVMFDITDAILIPDPKKVLNYIEQIHASGSDLKRFLKSYIQFILDVNKYALGCDWGMLSLPKLDEYENRIKEWLRSNDIFKELLQELITVDSNIKYSAAPKYDIEAALLVWMMEG